ncbi:MAG: DUF433 domain-containing protein [Isosphaeraceae bacterium]
MFERPAEAMMERRLGHESYANADPKMEALMESVIAQHIAKTPGVCGGRACIAGHRIRVMDIVVLHEMRGYCAAEIATTYPGITMADVHAALAYYFDNVEEIQNEFRRDEEAAKELLIRHPSKVREKLGG